MTSYPPPRAFLWRGNFARVARLYHQLMQYLRRLRQLLQAVRPRVAVRRKGMRTEGNPPNALPRNTAITRIKDI